jgi:hypothetical protein
MSEELLSVEIRAAHKETQYPGRVMLDWAERVHAMEIRLAEFENDETPTRRELALAKRRLKAAAAWAFQSEMVETGMLQHELDDQPGVAASEFREDWMEGWIEGLLEE